MLTGFGAVTNTGFASTPRCSSLPAMRCDSSPALHWSKTLPVHVWNNFQFKYIQRLLCKRSVCILAVWAGLWLKPSYTTPFWMHVRGSQLTSLASSQTFIDPTTFPLFQKLEEKVSRSLLDNEGGRIWKLLWMTSSVQTYTEIGHVLWSACRDRRKVNISWKNTFLVRQMLVERASSPVLKWFCGLPQPIVPERNEISGHLVIRKGESHNNHQKWLQHTPQNKWTTMHTLLSPVFFVIVQYV